VFSLLPLAALGFFLGVRHATDPDHVIAVGTIVSRERRIGTAALIGALWGVGHTGTILLAGAAIVFFGLIVPPRVGFAMELAVAVMLIGLGVWSLAGLGRPPAAPSLGALDRYGGRLGFYQAVRPLLVGVVHGLAGSAGVALLVVASIRDPILALAYLLVFGLGTVAGMMAITAAIALPFAYTARRFRGVNRSLALTAGVCSAAVGLFLLYQIGLVEGLLTGRY
jgi:high-affinity nickel-transport protein